MEDEELYPERFDLMDKVRKKGINHTCIRRSLHKKKLAPKGYTHLVVIINLKRGKCSMGRYIPVDISKEQQQLVEYDLVMQLIEHYNLNRYS